MLTVGVGSPRFAFVQSATLDRAFDALANDCRRDIVLRLSVQPLDTPALLDAYDMSRQAFNRHLKVLEDAGLIERELRGRVHRVALRGPAIDEVTDWLGVVRQAWESSLDQLGEVLAESHNQPDQEADS